MKHKFPWLLRIQGNQFFSEFVGGKSFGSIFCTFTASKPFKLSVSSFANHCSQFPPEFRSRKFDIDQSSLFHLKIRISSAPITRSYSGGLALPDTSCRSIPSDC